MFKKKVKQRSETSSTMPPLQSKDDALFETLNRNKKARKRKLIRTVVTIVMVLAVILVAAVVVLQRQVREQFGGEAQEVLSEQAQRGTISTVVSGSGMLLNVDTETISVPAGVEVTEVLVAYGDTVEKGDLLAVVDMATVRTAMSELQEEIEDLDDQITDAEGDTVSSYISAGVPGRVKIIYGETDMLVEDAMVDHGGLAEISLDGYMAVDIETDAVTEGDAVAVILSDGEEMEGTVKSVVGKNATILVTDHGPEYDEEVKVKDEDGTELGSGKLYIHNPLKVTGYAGTIKTVNTSLNQQVYSGTTLFTLTDTSSTASYDALLRSRSEKEETLLELLKIQRYGGMVSPISGSIYSVVDLDEETEEETEEITDIITISADVSMSVTISVDEGDILSLELGQEADVTVSSVSEDTLKGTVTEIDKTDSSGAYTAVVTLDKVEGMIPGMTASVDVRIEGVDDAIIIPVEALHQTSTGYYVYTSYDEETEEFGGRVDVIPGISNSNYVEIKSGLSEGDTVYYTEEQNPFGNMGFGNMGAMPNMGGNQSGGQMPGGDRNNGGSRNNGGGMPSGGGMPGNRG
ncbi:MAG: HlyD family efflux transporter periplasmic adaptor subunit [Oscillospiraceae bacterium]|nr:HlyD family efflux transporter periplasmic adaptor subunit [Oscillospiraceae bacterium]